MFRRIWHYFKRQLAYRQLDRKPPNLDDAVQAFRKAGGNDIEELCETLVISPIALYESVSEREKCNVRVRMNERNRELLQLHIHRKIFGDST